MKKILSSFLIATITLTSFSAVSCFAAGEDKSTQTVATQNVVTEKTKKSPRKSKATKKQSNKLKTAAGYAITAAAVAASAYFAYRYRQDISKFAKDAYKNYVIPAKTWSAEKVAETINNVSDASNNVYDLAKETYSEAVNNCNISIIANLAKQAYDTCSKKVLDTLNDIFPGNTTVELM